MALYKTNGKQVLTTYAATLTSSTNTTQVIKAGIDSNGRGIIEGQILWSGAGGAGAFSVSLPTGWTIATGQLPGGTGTTNQTASLLGYGYWFDNGVGWLFIFPKYISTTAVGFIMNSQVFAGDQAASGDSINFRLDLPLA